MKVRLQPFEVDVLSHLTAGVLSTEALLTAIRDGEEVGYEHTGVGYFYTLKHPGLPQDRQVLSRPLVLGEWNGVEASFVVFLESHQLMLECVTTDDSLPVDYRLMPVVLRVTDH